MTTQTMRGDATTVNAPHPCTGCGRVVAYRTRVQRRVGAGKHRVPHKCPHGVPCVFGSPAGGEGWNGPAFAGKYHCPQCFALRRQKGEAS